MCKNKVKVKGMSYPLDKESAIKYNFSYWDKQPMMKIGEHISADTNVGNIDIKS